MKRQMTAALILAFIWACGARAWWDTQIMVVREVPKVAEVEAEAVVQGAAVVDDAPPFGFPAGGGKAVRLEPGKGKLVWTVDVKRSIYAVFAIARVAEAEPDKNPAPEWPVAGRLRVTGPDGALVGDWSLPTSYLNIYYDTSRLYFPANADGRYTIEYSLTDDSEANLLVDRLELRDVLGNTMKQGFKRGRNLYTDAEVAQIRRDFQERTPQAKVAMPGQEPGLDPAGRAERLATFKKLYGDGYEKWNLEISKVTLPFRTYGPPIPQAIKYLDTGDAQAALDTAMALIYWADRYPAIDRTAQYLVGDWNCLGRGVRFSFTDSRFGKLWYSGHATYMAESAMQSYDYIFPFIEANADELAAMAATRVPWVKTKQDLIDYLDTRVMQHVGDCVNRRIIRAAEGTSEQTMLMAALVQGPSPAADRMLHWLFTNTYLTATNDGGIQDHAISSQFRDGSNIIGSIGYTEGAGALFVKAADYTGRYVALGGNKAFDLTDLSRFPSILPGALFPLACRLAGGYQANVGDWDRPFNTRKVDQMKNWADDMRFAYRQTHDPRTAWLLKNLYGHSTESDAEWAEVTRLADGQRDPLLSSTSRDLRGFALAVLESGAETDDFTKKRALTMRYDIGKGHAHADSLNIEFFSNGVRLIPDAGSRGGHPHPGNMDVHLGVTVDGWQMHNTGEVNTSGTAWITTFKPLPGVQYVAGGARFAWAPQVKRYERQAALIDIAGTDASYVFDVLRVAGGKGHVWHTHGPAMTPDDRPTYSADLAPATSEGALTELRDHVDPREGTCGEALVSTWPLGKPYEERMLNAGGTKAFVPGQPPIFARSTLFGHAGDRVYVGDSDPNRPGLEGSQWACTVGLVHVAHSGGENLETTWMQLLEGYRGEPLIRSARQPTSYMEPSHGDTALHVRGGDVAMMPAGSMAGDPMAMAVETVTGQRDVIIASGHGLQEITAGNVTLMGCFGYLSYDAKGLRKALLSCARELRDDKMRIVAERPEYRSRIEAVDYANRRITLADPLPPALLDGEEFLTGNPAHPQTWRIVQAAGRILEHEQSAVLYQSEITSLDEKTGEVIGSINPPFLTADPLFYNGVTAADESGKHLWRVKEVKPKYLWMYLQMPVQDWREKYTDADFPDANGDGRRTVTITNWGGGDGSPAYPKIELEVAFVDAARQVIYFKLPDNEKIVEANGWQWQSTLTAAPDKQRWMIANEAGRRWLPNYAGKTNVIALEGAVKDADFTDADGDGRRVLRLYHFGPGDFIEARTHVYVARKPDGTYEIQSSVPATVTLPDGSKRVTP